MFYSACAVVNELMDCLIASGAVYHCFHVTNPLKNDIPIVDIDILMLCYAHTLNTHFIWYMGADLQMGVVATQAFHGTTPGRE